MRNIGFDGLRHVPLSGRVGLAGGAGNPAYSTNNIGPADCSELDG
jgi:hypothetical protein